MQPRPTQKKDKRRFRSRRLLRRLQRPKLATGTETLTGKQGLDVVYDPVGGDKAEPAFRSLAPAGDSWSWVLPLAKSPRIPLNLALLKRSAIVGVDWGGEMRANPAINQTLMTTLMQWVRDGTLKPAQCKAGQ